MVSKVAGEFGGDAAAQRDAQRQPTAQIKPRCSQPKATTLPAVWEASSTAVGRTLAPLLHPPSAAVPAAAWRARGCVLRRCADPLRTYDEDDHGLGALAAAGAGPGVAPGRAGGAGAGLHWRHARDALKACDLETLLGARAFGDVVQVYH